MGAATSASLPVGEGGGMGSEAETQNWESGCVILEINQVENQD